MSKSTFINNVFSELVKYLDSIKVPLGFLRERSLNDEEIDMLSQHRNILEEIKKKIGSYKEDVESTIQDIDFILPHANANTNANANATGGKRYKRKTRKMRKMRNNRKK